jgi:hypothetical protein
MCDFVKAKTERDNLEFAAKEAGEELRAFPKGPMNLTPDHIKATPEWKAAKLRFDRAFAALRDFNVVFTKQYATELRAERNARFSR